MANEIKIAAAVMALIRGDITASCVADEFGVTEVQVQRWKDIFQVAGVIALTKVLRSGEMLSDDDCSFEPTTPHPSRPRPQPTTRRPSRIGKGVGEPTTKKPPPKTVQKQRKKKGSRV